MEWPQYLLQCVFCPTQTRLYPTLSSLCSIIDSSRWWPVIVFKHIHNVFQRELVGHVTDCAVWLVLKQYFIFSLTPTVDFSHPWPTIPLV